MARTSMKNLCNLIKQAEQKLPVEQSFLVDLKRSIELDDIKNSRPPSCSYTPSGMKCMRQSYYQITGAQEDTPTSSYTGVGICNSGSDIHERIQTAVSQMKDNGFDCEYVDVAKFVKSRKLDYLDIVEKKGMETKLYHKDLNIRFLCDGIIKYQNRYYILELKTETSNKWFTRQGVDKYHYNQAVAYSAALGLDNVIFVYISRDTLDMKSYMFEVTEDMRYKMYDYIATCDAYIEKKKCPPKPDTDKKTCEYCHYKEQCRKDGM